MYHIESILKGRMIHLLLFSALKSAISDKSED